VNLFIFFATKLYIIFKIYRKFIEGKIWPDFETN